MSITPITPLEKNEMRGLHDSFDQKVKLTGCCVAAAAFLIIGALIVITCGGLCFMLPGVNVIEDVVLKAIVPGLCALVVSIPFVVLSVSQSRDKNLIREQQKTRMLALLDSYDIPDKPQEDQVNFILHHFLNWPEGKKRGEIEKNKNWTADYQRTFLKELNEKIGKKEDLNPRQKILSEALDEAMVKLTSKQ
jgi:hypothetical protein